MSFATAAATLFADPIGSEAGTFVPAVGAPVACRVLFTKPDPTISLGRAGARNAGCRVDVWLSGLPARPTVEDRIIARATTYRIRGVEVEPRGCYATLDVDPI
jgi:hypothetical protein